MSRTRAAYRIAQRVKYEETKPERVVEIIMASLRYYCAPPQKIELLDTRGRYWTITPDLLTFPNYVDKVVVEVDGPYHQTPIQQRKTVWRDGLLTKAGYRVIHVDAELTKNQKLRDYLKEKLKAAIESKEPVVNIHA